MMKPIGPVLADVVAKAKPQVVRLTKQGERRVLNGKEGMVFEVDHWGGVNGRCAQVADRRFLNGLRPQIWTLAPEDFEPA